MGIDSSYLHAGWSDILDENFISMVEHGYDTAIMFGHEKNSLAALEALEPFLSLCEEYGMHGRIGVPFEISQSLEATTHAGWTVADYAAEYGEYFDILESDSRVDGYFCENVSYVGLQWLRAATSKIFTLDFYGMETDLITYFNQIIAMCDEFDFETFQIVIPPQCVAVIPSLYAAKPTLKIGGWHQTLPLWPYDISLYWGPDTHTPPPVPYDGVQQASGLYLAESDTQQHLAQYWYRLINAQMVTTFGHKLDFSIAQWWDCMGTFDEMLNFNDYLNLTYHPTGVINKPVQQMEQKGHVPAYGGAAICTYPATSPLVDTFTNTGNEIIMLKSAGRSCNVHALTVTGTSATQNYTVAIPPDRATFLGPYSIDEFGTLPTITYDNTNLYISIVGET